VSFAPGPSVGRGARWTTGTRSRPCIARSISGSICSTPPTCMATGAANDSRAASRRRARRDRHPTKAGTAPGEANGGRLQPRKPHRVIDRNRKNLGTDCLDLVQLHCPPTDLYYAPEVFGILDDFGPAGKIRFYGGASNAWRKRSRRLNIPVHPCSHLQYVPPPPGRSILRAGEEEAGGHPRRVAAGKGLLTGR